MKKVTKLSSRMKTLPPSGVEPNDSGKQSRDERDLGDAGELVAGRREGDGVDPQIEARRRRSVAGHGRPGLANGPHQQERFIAQVRMSVDSALQTAATAILNALSVREVVKEAGALLVVLEPRDPAERLDVLAATQAVKRASSMVRREVASAITRKGTPELRFVVLPAGAERVDEQL